MRDRSWKEDLTESKWPSGHVWACWISYTWGNTASLGNRAYHLHTENCSCQRTNCETFNVGLQLLNEPKWALAVKTDHTHSQKGLWQASLNCLGVIHQDANRTGWDRGLPQRLQDHTQSFWRTLGKDSHAQSREEKVKRTWLFAENVGVFFLAHADK